MKTKHLSMIVTGFILVITAGVQSQTLYNGVGHIPASYQETWNVAGLLQDMSSVEPKLVIPISPGAASAQVSAAINTARSHVNTTGGLVIIYFPEGTFYFTSTIQLTQNDRNIVFQGAGSDKTTLIFQNLKNYNCFALIGTVSGWIDLDQDIDKGESVIHASPVGVLSGIAIGDWVHFIKRNFDYHTPRPSEFEAEIVGQITRITAQGSDATGDWREIKDEANMDYEDAVNTDYSLKVRKVSPVQNIGIENLKIIRSPNEKPTVGNPYNIYLEYAINCWVKGVESFKAACHHIGVSRSSHCEITGCYIHEAMDYGEGGWGYGVLMYGSSTNCLIENNIFKKLRHAMIAGGGSNCNVWTFNYSLDQYGGGYNYDLDLHAKYPFGHLFEHNIVDRIAADDYHGDNGPFNAFVRNMTTKSYARIWKMKQWSTLGNMQDEDDLLYPLRHDWNYAPAVDIYGVINNYTLGLSHNVTYDFGYAVLCRLDDISYYYSSKPEFLDGYTWPSIGPKTTTGGELSFSIPAYGRYNSAGKKTYLKTPTHIK